MIVGRCLRLSLAVVAAALALVALVPSPAAAHASLVSTDPGSRPVVDEPPEAITLAFNEPVEVAVERDPRLRQPR